MSFFGITPGRWTTTPNQHEDDVWYVPTPVAEFFAGPNRQGIALWAEEPSEERKCRLTRAQMAAEAEANARLVVACVNHLPPAIRQALKLLEEGEGTVAAGVLIEALRKVEGTP